MEDGEKEVKRQLKQHLKGVTGSTFETIVKRLGVLSYERMLLTSDIGIALAASNLRAALEMLRAAPEVSRFIEAGDMRVWGEVGKRLSATSAEAAMNFFQLSPPIIEAIAEEMRSPVLRLVNKQAALSANTALECFKAAPGVISSIADRDSVAQVLTICLELARHSVKHSSDLLLAAPGVLEEITRSPAESGGDLVKRTLALTSAFAFRSGGAAAEFFMELPQVLFSSDRDSLDKLFAVTESYLDRSGGVALQYFKAASRVLSIAGQDAFERWT